MTYEKCAEILSRVRHLATTETFDVAALQSGRISQREMTEIISRKIANRMADMIARDIASREEYICVERENNLGRAEITFRSEAFVMSPTNYMELCKAIRTAALMEKSVEMTP